MVYHSIVNIVPMLYSTTLLFIHSINASFHLVIPKSQSVPFPPPLPLGNWQSLLCICDSVS